MFASVGHFNRGLIFLTIYRGLIEQVGLFMLEILLMQRRFTWSKVCIKHIPLDQKCNSTCYLACRSLPKSSWVIWRRWCSNEQNDSPSKHPYRKWQQLESPSTGNSIENRIAFNLTYILGCEPCIPQSNARKDIWYVGPELLQSNWNRKWLYQYVCLFKEVYFWRYHYSRLW